MKIISLVLLVWLTSGVCGAEEQVNYCHDPAAEAEWVELLAKYPQDLDVQALHALRIGICTKVDHGVLTVEEGTRIFENAREALVEYKANQERREKLKSKINL